VYPSVDPTKPELSLAGKVVIITGASRGIGAKVISILEQVGTHDN
jgi:NADP-dependent 3-hydroxy acid dehydrogenase YdfG